MCIMHLFKIVHFQIMDNMEIASFTWYLEHIIIKKVMCAYNISTHKHNEAS